MLAVRMRMRTGFLESELKTGWNLGGNANRNQELERVIGHSGKSKEEIGEPLPVTYFFGRNAKPWHLPDGGTKST
ncbi:MAG: hypothetical protein D4R65_06490 [Verrucomicrobiaceae bacterium]|nr:MAG: hypothetical protein D4R65_06490 [Verrucomicrobiaceae bacterium]